MNIAIRISLAILLFAVVLLTTFFIFGKAEALEIGKVSVIVFLIFAILKFISKK